MRGVWRLERSGRRHTPRGAGKNPETGVVHFVATREKERTLLILIHFFAELHKLPLKWMNQIVRSVRHLSEPIQKVAVYAASVQVQSNKSRDVTRKCYTPLLTSLLVSFPVGIRVFSRDGIVPSHWSLPVCRNCADCIVERYSSFPVRHLNSRDGRNCLKYVVDARIGTRFIILRSVLLDGEVNHDVCEAVIL
jgi:hypothetical protein